MTDLEALELLRADIYKLLPPGPVRDPWLVWSNLLSAEDPPPRESHAHIQLLRRDRRGKRP